MSNRPVVPEAKQGLNKFKLEVADELNIEDTTKETHDSIGYMGNVPSSYAGKIGGSKGRNLGGAMMSKIIEEEEKIIADKYSDKKH